jgi:hypothetical protein
VLVEQRRILREAFEKYNGTEIDNQGDSILSPSPRAT